MNPTFPNRHGYGMTSLRTRQRLIKQLQEAGIREQNVLDTLLNVPRHWFVDEALATRAYENTALPIGFGQTISQPYTVARMTELLLADQARPRVLEIGTGSGYHTSVLASLVEHVFSVERIGKLLDRARERLRELGLNNVRLKYDDGLLGWPRYAPFDGIIVTAAADAVPEGLLEQLRQGGRLVMPIGRGTVQELTVFERKAFGMETRPIEKVNFVPLLGGVL